MNKRFIFACGFCIGGLMIALLPEHPIWTVIMSSIVVFAIAIDK